MNILFFFTRFGSFTGISSLTALGNEFLNKSELQPMFHLLNQRRDFKIFLNANPTVPDGIVGGVGVVSRDSPDGAAHFGVFRNKHPAKWCGKDRWLVHILHCHLDRCCVAKRAQTQEVGVDIPVCSFDSQRKAALRFKV